MLFKSSGGVKWIIVFLGNPGKKYDGTRHNVGFQSASLLEKRDKIKINRARFNALTATAQFGGEKVLLMLPQTFMNLSGNAVAPACAFYKVAPSNVIVICDDMALPVGKLRIRQKGSSGGHNGLKSIASSLGTDEFPRIKIGVGVPPTHENGSEVVIDWVLGTFSSGDKNAIETACKAAFEAAETYISEGPDRAMNKFN